MVSVTHATTATGTNNGSKQVSVDAWNEGHVVTGVIGSFNAVAADRTALAALATTNGSAFLKEAGREGTFVWSSANNATNVTNDPNQGIYVPPSSDTTGASGAWVRKFSGEVNARWFGADGSGDDATALQAAYDFAADNQFTLYIPGDDYSIGSALAFDTDGTRVRGDGWEKTRLLTTAATPAVVVSMRYGFISGIGCDGTTAGTYGFVMKNAAETTLEWCDARNFDNDGLLFDPTYGGGAAVNNNTAKVVGGSFNLNGRYGVNVALDGNNNNIKFYGVNCSSNTSHGFLVKSEGGTIDSGCIAEGNGGYGIQIGEDADASASVGWLIDAPWVEANTSGGVRGSAKSSDNTIRLKDSNSQTYSRAVGATDTVQTISGGRWLPGSSDGDTSIEVTANTTESYIKAASRTQSNVNLNLYGKGTGKIIPQSEVSGASRIIGGTSLTGDVAGTSFVTASVAARRNNATDGKTSTLEISHEPNGGQVYLQSELIAASGFSNYVVRVRDASGMTERFRVNSDGSVKFSNVAAFNGSGILQAAAFPALAGDVTTSAGSLATTIAANAVTYAKFVAATAKGIVGASAAGNFAQLGLANGLDVSGGNLILSAATPASVAATGAITSSSATAGIGYASGARGTVTQLTSKSTGVTSNTVVTDITLNGAALASATTVSFTFTNSAIAANDAMILNHVTTGTFGGYNLNAHSFAAGSCVIDVRNLTGGSLSEAIVIRAVLVKGG